MSAAIKMVMLFLIFLPYKLSDLGRNASFTRDFLVAAVAFGIAYAIIALTGADKEADNTPPTGNRSRTSS